MFLKKAQPKAQAEKKFDTGRTSKRTVKVAQAESRRGYRQFGQIRYSQGS